MNGPAMPCRFQFEGVHAWRSFFVPGKYPRILAGRVGGVDRSSAQDTDGFGGPALGVVQRGGAAYYICIESLLEDPRTVTR